MTKNSNPDLSVNWKEANNGLIINVPTEFDFRPNLEYLQRDKNECMYEIEDETVTRVIVVDGDRMLMQVSEHDSNHLFVHFLAGPEPKSVDKKAAIVQYVRDWFDMDNDLAPFYDMAQHDPMLKQPIKDFYGLRLMGIPDLFEALCWGILGQQINLKFAYILKRQFVETFGNAVEYKGKTYWVFPSYEKIAKLTPMNMGNIKMTVRKSEYIIGIAQLMANSHLSKEKLLVLNDFKKIEKALIQIRGIGPWTANYVLMRCLRFPEAFPVDDVGLINTIKHLKEIDRKPTKQEILRLASPWVGWEAYATFYLWRVLYLKT